MYFIEDYVIKLNLVRRLVSQGRKTFEFSINVKWLLRNSETFSAKFIFFPYNMTV